MRTLNRSLILAIIIVLPFLLFSQDHQVTQQAPYIVGAPSLAVSNGKVHLAYGTNYYYYQFPTAGPSTPITNPVSPNSHAYGPYRVNVQSLGDFIYIVYSDYNSSVPQFEIQYDMSLNGTAWNVHQVIGKFGNPPSISLRADNPTFRMSSKAMYCLYMNYADSNKIVLHRSTGSAFGSGIRVDTWDTSAVEEKTMELQIVTVSGVDHLYLFYSIDKNIYMIHSPDEGASFSAPALIYTIPNAMFGYYNSISSICLASGTFYLATSYFGMGEIHTDGSATVVLRSTNSGGVWNLASKLDPGSFTSPKLFSTSTGTLVTAYNSGGNIYVRSSKNGSSWSDTVRVNSAWQNAASHAGALIDDQNLAVAWIDSRNGSNAQEIFYRAMPLPTAPVTSVRNNDAELPQSPIIVSNYPNPFNPSTTIRLELSQAGVGTLRVYDLLGRVVDELSNGFMTVGTHTIQWNAGHHPSGMYLARFTMGNQSALTHMLLTK